MSSEARLSQAEKDDIVLPAVPEAPAVNDVDKVAPVTPATVGPPDRRQPGPAVNQVLPLAMTDKRFEILRTATLREMRKRFMKLFQHTFDKDSRYVVDEMAVFLATTVAGELGGAIQTLTATLSSEQLKEFMAEHDPMKVFLNAFIYLMSGLNQGKESAHESVSHNHEGVPETAGKVERPVAPNDQPGGGL